MQAAGIGLVAVGASLWALVGTTLGRLKEPGWSDIYIMSTFVAVAAVMVATGLTLIILSLTLFP